MDNSSKIEIQPLPSVVKVRPMLMFTGFLGAGKTTLLRELLGHLSAKDILSDVILNDRENAYLDKSTLIDHAADVVALTGSCVCCEGFQDLVEIVLKASKSQHHLLLIELNGTADPVPLQESFTLLESKFCLRPRWQICVIDARHFKKRRRYNDLEKLQLETASHYYISWCSDLTDQEEIQIQNDIKTINSRATRTNASELAEALTQTIQNNSGQALTSQRKKTNKQASSKFSLTPPAKEHMHDHHKLAHEFTGCQIMIPEPVEPSHMDDWLMRIPPSAIRVKALVSLKSDTDLRHLYERVGKFISPKPISARAHNKSPSSAIFIGADLDPEELLSLTQEHLHQNCYFPKNNA